MSGGFTNPGNGGRNRDRYVHRSLYKMANDPNDSRIHEASEKAVFKLLNSGAFDMNDALSSKETTFEVRERKSDVPPAQRPSEKPEKIESFTEESPISTNLGNSYFTSVQFNTETGFVAIQNEAGEPFEAWIPWLQEESKGSVMAQIYSPWEDEISTIKYGYEDVNTDGFDPKLLGSVYIVAREAIPDVPISIGRGNWDEKDFKQKFSKILKSPENKDVISYLEQLEKNGEVTIGHNQYIGDRQGKDALNYLHNMVNKARDARIVDYFTKVDASNHRIERLNGGYKFLTILEDTAYENPMDAIDGRIADSWRDENGK